MARKRKAIKIDTPKLESIQERTISSFLQNEYLEYSLYVAANRAIPSVMDGLRTGARKILYAGLAGPFKNGKPDKLTILAGDTMRIAMYQHGDASLYNTIAKLSSEYTNNLNPFEIDGQGGSLRNLNAIAAPRYLYILLSKYAKLIYGVDEDLIEQVYDEGRYVEPKFYLPIIPTVLTSRDEGIGVGYAFSGFSYNPIDIINACIFALNGGEVEKQTITPYVRGVKKTNFQFNEDAWRWESFGEYEINETGNCIIVKDLPYDTQYESYEKHLNSLVNSEFITEWENNSVDDKIRYYLYFKRGEVARLKQNPEALIKKLGLITRIDKDNLTVINLHGKLQYFAHPGKLIEYFVQNRLTFYDLRKTKLVNALEKKIAEAELLAKFISLVIKKKIKVANVEIELVKAALDEYSLPHSMLEIKLSKITKTEYDKQLALIANLKDELEYVLNTTPKQMYINDLIALHEEIEADFN